MLFRSITYLDINAITVHRQIVLTSSEFVVSFDICSAIITTLIDRHCDGGMRSDLFGMTSASKSVEMR